MKSCQGTCPRPPARCKHDHGHDSECANPRESFLIGTQVGVVRVANLPIFQYWHDRNVPAEVIESTRTFRDLNPGMDHRLLHELDADEFIAEHFTTRELRAFRSCAVPAMQADYFRYCALTAFGGIWVDVDFHCLRSLEDLVEPEVTGLMFRPKEVDFPTNNCFLMFTEPRHPMPRLLLDVSTANIEQRVSDTVSCVTGPEVLVMLGATHRLGSFEAAGSAFQGKRCECLARSIADAVGDTARVDEAFRGLRVVHGAHLQRWIDGRSHQMAYKQGENHWVNWQAAGRPIFKSPVGGRQARVLETPDR